jgi:hypothetical protein
MDLPTLAETENKLAGGIDDTALYQMTTYYGQIFFGKGNVEMTAVFADSAVETQDLAVLRDLLLVHTACISDPTPGQTAYGREHHCGRDVMLLCQAADA